MFSRLHSPSQRLLFQIALIALASSFLINFNILPFGNQSMSPPLSPSSTSITIFLNGDAVGAVPGWNNSSPGPMITVTSGETVHLLLNATDSLAHNWFIDTQKDDTPDPNGISSPDFSLSSTKVLNFTFVPIIGQNIPSPGNWTYRCKYHPIPYMYGTIQILASDFTISASPAQITTTPNSAATTIINIVSAYSETVNLTSTAETGVQTLLAPKLLLPGTTTLTVNTPSVGNYTVTITGAIGNFTHSFNITVEVGDFTISANPQTIQAQTNTASSSNISITAINHFAGQLTLSTNNSYCNVTPVIAGVSDNIRVSCTFPTQGTFLVSVIATDNSLTHSSTLNYNVTGTQASQTSPLNWSLILIASAATALILVGTLTYLSKKSTKGPSMQ